MISAKRVNATEAYKGCRRLLQHSVLLSSLINSTPGGANDFACSSDSDGGTGSMRVFKSRPSEVNPHLFGAAPAMYAHALSSVSLRKTYKQPHTLVLEITMRKPPHCWSQGMEDLKHTRHDAHEKKEGSKYDCSEERILTR
jgi:hypothetical protein